MAHPKTKYLASVIQREWGDVEPDRKVERYIGQFFDQERIGSRLQAKVVGNHGTYTVSITVRDGQAQAVCSCHIGRHGFCHHVVALAKTFLNDPGAFVTVRPLALDDVRTLGDLPRYLEYVTLAELLAQLKAAGITQKAFAESIGISARSLTAMKASEARNRRRWELGAVKLAVLWALGRFGEGVG